MVILLVRDEILNRTRSLLHMVLEIGKLLNDEGVLRTLNLMLALVVVSVGKQCSTFEVSGRDEMTDSLHRVWLAENWRRRNKFEEVSFIFPSAPMLPITLVSLACRGTRPILTELIEYGYANARMV